MSVLRCVHMSAEGVLGPMILSRRCMGDTTPRSSPLDRTGSTYSCPLSSLSSP